ncbi:hypothetical protein V8F33_013100 [Rhypophila sp. PSN 637]
MNQYLGVVFFSFFPLSTFQSPDRETVENMHLDIYIFVPPPHSDMSSNSVYTIASVISRLNPFTHKPHRPRHDHWLLMKKKESTRVVQWIGV